MSEYRIHGATGEWEVVIGLEVHAQVTSNAKLFSGASTEFGAEPNTQVSLVDAAMPGMLPVLNVECVRQAVRTGMALEAKINAFSPREKAAEGAVGVRSRSQSCQTRSKSRAMRAPTFCAWLK